MFGHELNIEKLIRDSERLAIVKDFIKSEDKYISTDRLMVLLGIDEEKEDSNAD